jgi:SPP1 gp7 family putative phage head morphogenesis protein
MAIDSERQLGGMPDNINEEFFDALVRHQIGLLRVNGRIRKRIIELLDETEKDISRQIKIKLRGVSGLERPSSVNKLDALVAAIKRIRATAVRSSMSVLREELIEIAKHEPTFVADALSAISPTNAVLAIPTADALADIVRSRPFQGKVLRDWAKNIEAADIERISDQIKIGLVQGESSQAIARRVVGTVSLKGIDGVTEITRRNAAALSRTAVNAIANQARRDLFKANADLFEEEIYVATLDSRTTAICRSLDGERFPVGKGPIPPLHFNCRSLRVASLDGEAIGQRPAKPSTQKQLLREFSDKNNLGSISSRSKLPRGFKGKFDEFARQRIRETTGQIDSKISYQQWLTRQSKEFQDDVLGKTKGKLFRDGGLTLDKFVNRKGDELTLAELARREKSAFKKAGLDVDDF